MVRFFPIAASTRERTEGIEGKKPAHGAVMKACPAVAVEVGSWTR
jgi:hypothetical protein